MHREGTDNFSQEGVNLNQIYQVFLHRQKWIFGITAASFLGMLAFVHVVTPRYSANVKLLLENQESSFTQPDRSLTAVTMPDPDESAIGSQVQVITSQNTASNVIKSLNLLENPAFNSPPSLISRLMSSLMPSSSDARSDVIPEAARLEFLNNLFVADIPKTRVLQIEYTSKDPDLSAKIANTIAALYIEQQISLKRKLAAGAAASLADQSNQLKAQLSKAEERAERFRAENNLLLGPNNTALTTQQFADLSAQLTSAQSAQSEAQAKANLIREMVKAERLGEVSDIAQNPLVQKLSEERARVRAQISQESQTLLSNHPRMRELNAQLTSLQGELREAAEKAARNLENDARVALARYESLKMTLESQRRTFGGETPNETRARELDRDAKLIRDQLEIVMAKYQEAYARQKATSTPGDARIISTAHAPSSPSFPKKIPMIAFATIAGFVLSTLAFVFGLILKDRPPTSHTPHGSDPRGTKSALESEEQGISKGALSQESPSTFPQELRRLKDRIVSAFGRGSESKILQEFSTQTSLLGSGIKAMQQTAHLHHFEEEDVEKTLADIVHYTSFQKSATRAACLFALVPEGESAADHLVLDLARQFTKEGRTILVDMRQSLDCYTPLGISNFLEEGTAFAKLIRKDPHSSLHLIDRGNQKLAAGAPLKLAMEALSQTYAYVILVADEWQKEQEGEVAFGLASFIHPALLFSVSQQEGNAHQHKRFALQQAGIERVFVCNLEEEVKKAQAKVA